jgi:hypothetical protein
VDGGSGWRRQAVGDDLGNNGGGGGQGWIRTADNGKNEWAMVCVVYGDGGVNIISQIFFLARQSHQASRIVTVLVVLLVGIVRVHYLYLNPKICKYQFFSTDILTKSVPTSP